MLIRIHNDLIINGKDSTEFNKDDIYFEMQLLRNDTYIISMHYTNKNGIKKSMQLDDVKFVLQNNYRYHEVTPREPLILEPEDWSENE